MRKMDGGRVLLVVFLFVLTTSCARHFYDVAWKGIVVDAQTGLPVPLCEMQINCFYQDNMDRSGHRIYQSRTDLFGNFELTLEKGYRINSQFSAHGYEPVDFTLPLLPGNLPRVIQLTKKDGAEQSKLEVRVFSEAMTGTETPYMGVKYQVVDSQKFEFVELIGFDLLNGKSSICVDSADVWIELSRDSGLNPVVYANRKGGLYPVSRGSDSLSFHLLNADYAPVDGYASNYRLTGYERFFFVKCRDGVHYAKLILDGYLCVIQYGAGADSFKEFGLRFGYVVQRDPSQPRFFPERLISELVTPNRQPGLHTHGRRE